MTWGVFLCEQSSYPDYIKYASYVMADDLTFDYMFNEFTKEIGAKILGGKKGIGDNEINEISERVKSLKEKLIYVNK